MVDRMAQGIAAGWQVQDASLLDTDLNLETDVVIVGTGAGGGICAEGLAKKGFRVILVEEGPLKSSSDFKMDERQAYPDLYQESAGRQTLDKAFTILQGRCVGGSTTVNWTSSFETPKQTLNHWLCVHGIEDCSPEEMAPWFEEIKRELGIAPWTVPPNANNRALLVGAERLGWSYGIMSRNVRGCANLGYCGLGCPLDAKQSMLTTALPSALEMGAQLLSRTRAHRLVFKGDRVDHLVCHGLDASGVKPNGRRIVVRAKQFVVAGGAIGSPALLLRSGAPDPHQVLGKRTFLHPVMLTTGIMPDRVDPYYGAPQSVYSDAFLWPDGVDGPMGYKIEVPPLHPLISSTVLSGHGSWHADLMKQFPYMQAVLGLCRDGFHPESPGGTVKLKHDGSPGLDYPTNDYLWDGVRRALASLAELQFAAGAKIVLPIHRHVKEPYRSWPEARKAIAELVLAPLTIKMFSAHVMGGCAMGGDARSAVVDPSGKHYQLENLRVIDGSVFPTSIGSNPQVSVFAMSKKNTDLLAKAL